mmetsp:Transcript_109987/g.310191  ORF Transcript_109987/g.310191 Transcript_109987/m.310191 type:complete len:270 (-) Transcript_109987:852-1661(-)
MTSPISAFRIGLSLPIAKSRVIAISFTTMKYTCRSCMNLRFPILPPWIRLTPSVACSASRPNALRDLSCSTIFSSAMESPPPDSLSKYVSNGTPKLTASSLNAFWILVRANSAIAAQAEAMALVVLLHLDAAASVFCFIFVNSPLAFNIGPFPLAFAAFRVCSFKQTCASLMAFPSVAARTSISPWSVSGVAKAWRSAHSLSESRGFEASSSFSIVAATASSFSFAGPMMASASRRSLSSLCALRSDSSFLAYSFLLAPTCRFNFSSRD